MRLLGKAAHRLRLRFSLRSLLIATALAAVVLGWPHMRRHYALQRIKYYAGVSLRELPEAELSRVNGWTEEFVGPCEPPCPGIGMSSMWRRWENWFVRLVGSGDGQRIYVIQFSPSAEYNGFAFGRLHILDVRGRLIATHEFGIGAMTWPRSARLSSSPRGFLALTIETQRYRGDRMIQTYSLGEDGVYLLRQEDADGELTRDSLGGWGSDSRMLNWSQAYKLIAAGDENAQLRGLSMFNHSYYYWWRGEKLQSVDVTRQRLRELSTSSDEWIRQGAVAAMHNLSHDRRIAPRWYLSGDPVAEQK